jgi:hypothetical protein
MATGYEVKMYQDLSNIASSLNRIANCMEAGEKRARKPVKEETCEVLGCKEPVIVTINEKPYCQLHVDQGFIRVREVITRATATQAAMEAAANLSIQDRVAERKREAGM